jgi:hypothetical protein
LAGVGEGDAGFEPVFAAVEEKHQTDVQHYQYFKCFPNFLRSNIIVILDYKPQLEEEKVQPDN